ncbi:MAG: hypothetical protein EOP85_05145 [Verrucomicrobiaceae bacterium]|nr:MAG: hypothetical protein EOP85_05145 [Verrucomicrobiaceae bacterium]
MSPEMQAISRNPDLLYNLGAGDLEKMSLDDPLLKYAYARVFMDSMGPFEQLESPMELVLADMRRRGEAVSPMLLKLIEENRETRIESSILGKIDHLETVRLEPFLEYARKVLRERTQSDVVAVASGLLARRGTEEDMKLFEWVLTQQPFAITDLTGNLKILGDRLNPPKPESRPERREMPTSGPGNDSRPTTSPDESPEKGSITTSRAKPWLIGGLILLALLGASRLLFKHRRGTGMGS